VAYCANANETVDANGVLQPEVSRASPINYGRDMLFTVRGELLINVLLYVI